MIASLIILSIATFIGSGLVTGAIRRTVRRFPGFMMPWYLPACLLFGPLSCVLGAATGGAFWPVRDFWMLLGLFQIYAGFIGLLESGRRGFEPDGNTRCGRCGYILRGLVEPRCSECGNRI